ncbi:hypothetical protein [Flavimaricola marinus]|uniref:Uncharacterized protein n=1 Tax=Flavimaricola marinus TaxID=1819565 RepID=A0A238LCS3_9RHOB|nr:hypothetical protein [Flavimaricola marinus]SMY07411.1 hypothetical protein LOM8899_01546 [Flavimaricola marinus]
MTQKMIVIGPLSQLSTMDRQLPSVEGVSFVDFADLPAHCFETEPPDIIVSALVGPTFDVLDVARFLESVGFKGAYRALSEGLPYPSVVLAEVAAVAPDLDFDVFIVPSRGSIKSGS